jgi:hypothetical protein
LRIECAEARGLLDRETDGLLAFWNEVNREDIAIVERVQSASPIHYGRTHVLPLRRSVHRFRTLIDSMLIRASPSGRRRVQRPMFAWTGSATREFSP